MNRPVQRVTRAALIAAVPAMTAVILQGQVREWTTSNGDAQRSSWVRSDVRLTKAAVESGEFTFLWKATFPNETRQLNSLTQPILLDRLISHRGFKALAFVGTSGERIHAVDSDLNQIYWTTVINYSSIAPPGNSTWACPGGMTAAVTRPTNAAPPALAGRGRGGARSGSAVGEPGRGAPNLQQIAQAQGGGRGRGRGEAGDPAPPAGPGRGAQNNPAAPPAPGTPSAQSRVAPATGLGGGPTENVYVLGSDGYVRALNAHNGAERFPAIQLLPANARAAGLILVDGILYTSTSNNCGAIPNGVYAVDLNTEEARTISWYTGGPNVAGTTGPAVGTDGTIFVAVEESSANAHLSPKGGTRYASSVVALDPKTLKPKDWFTAPGADFNASPTVFRYKDRDLVAATANDGRLYLLDGASLGGADHKTPLHVSPRYSAAGAAAGPSTWEDQGTRWILAPAVGAAEAGLRFAAHGPAPNGRIVAFKLAESAGRLALEPAWASRDMTSPLSPLIFSGVVFAASSGEYRGATEATLTAAQRAGKSTPAVLYALDPVTGKELWSSGRTITSFARSGLSASAGQVYLVTFDNTLYAFGIPMEH